MDRIPDGIYRVKGRPRTFLKIENMEVGFAVTGNWESVLNWDVGRHNHWREHRTPKELLEMLTLVSSRKLSLENK